MKDCRLHECTEIKSVIPNKCSVVNQAGKRMSKRDVIRPEVIVCLGATAAQALLGRQFKVSTQRGVWVESRLAPFVMATVHPSSLLRAPDDETRRRETMRFITDLKRVHEALEKQKVA